MTSYREISTNSWFLVFLSLVSALFSLLLFGWWWQMNQQTVLVDSELRSAASPVLATTSPSATLLPIATPTPSPLPPIPESKVLLGGSHSFQTFNNCGPASLSMALSHYGIDRTQFMLGNQLRPYQNQQGDNDDKSVTLEELSAKAEEFGFVVYHRPAGSMEVMQQFIAHDMPVVTRTWLEPGEDIGHYRVVKGYDRVNQTLVQDDSLQGANLRYTYDEFNQLWEAFNYEFMVMVPPEKQAVAEQILGPLVDEQVAWREALALAEQESALDPTNAFYQFNQLVALYHLGRYQEARVIFESIQSKLPSRMLWYQIEPLLVYYQLGMYDQVLSLSDQILENGNYAFSELHYLQGQIYRERGQNGLAQESFRLANQFNDASQIWLVNIQ